MGLEEGGNQNYSVSIKEAAALVGCSDKVIRNYIKDGKITFTEEEGPYGPQFKVNSDEIEAVYSRGKNSRVEQKVSRPSTGNSTPESTSLENILPTLERFQGGYQEAMEKMVAMSYELGNAHKEVKLLTGDSLERSALEKQVQQLIRENERLATEKKALEGEILQWKGKRWRFGK